MRTSLTELHTAAAYLLGQLPPQEALVYETRLLTSPALKTQFQALKKVFGILRLYHRKQLKSEAENLHRHLWLNPDQADFRRQIQEIFPQAGNTYS